MTLSCDGANDDLWASGVHIVSECLNIYSPSSCLSSQPCSPGPSGGLVGLAEKHSGDLAAVTFAIQDSANRSKRIRLNAEPSVRDGAVQAYNHVGNSQATSAQLTNSVTPSSQNSCGIEPFLQLSGGPKNFCNHLSSGHIGGNLAISTNLPCDAQPPAPGSMPELPSRVLLGFSCSDGLPGSGASSFAPEKPSSCSVPLWQPPLLQPQPQSQPQPQPQHLPALESLYQPLQPLYQPFQQPQQQPFQQLQQHLQQQLAQLVSEQPALVCSNPIGGMALSFTVLDSAASAAASNQLAPSVLPPNGSSLQSCATLAGGCGPSVGGFSLPFVFTGSSTVTAASVAAPPVPVAQTGVLLPLTRTLPSTLPCSDVPCSGFLNPSLVMPQKFSIGLGGVPMAPLAPPVLFSSLSNIAAGDAPSAVAIAPHVNVVAAPPTLWQHQPPSLLAPQPKTPRFAYLPETTRCGAAVSGVTGPKVVTHGSQPQLQPQLLLQPLKQSQQQQQPQLKLKPRQTHPRRVRPPSPPPPITPSTPLQLASLGSDDWILHAVKVLGMSEPDTARLALHCWRRVSGLPQLHHAARLWPTVAAGRNLYATACLWVSIKLEEKRRAAPGGVVLAHMAGVTAAALCSAELAVMNWLGWRPYDGYRLDESHLLVYM
ncbi:hypothetical protein Vretimale_14503 [Volvox reticuliferus]|uniref:Uncharacterized protein n=1 Tax=Volvox reticuliferus TaxID=1737510 RepID=A0A8J4FPE2_9CHLO|nr:hypothetical protein Vretifemale_13331 [Volvox reticuliferus]GIM10897.1 hypothetical protein Vretimale_14503 [Volvox reticuliferus]